MTTPAEIIEADPLADFSAFERATIKLIIAGVSDATGVCEASIMGRRRTARIAHARQLAMSLMREATGLSLMEIGGIFQRDHGTVMHAIKTIADRCGNDDETYFRRASILANLALKKSDEAKLTLASR